jgi:hypothetical protein
MSFLLLVEIRDRRGLDGVDQVHARSRVQALAPERSGG